MMNISTETGQSLDGTQPLLLAHVLTSSYSTFFWQGKDFCFKLCNQLRIWVWNGHFRRERKLWIEYQF